MGGMNWEGLFASQGNTLDDVRAKIGQEREGKVRQAYADAIKGGGSLNAARVARAAEQQKQLMMGTVQNLFGSKDGIIKQDPRLARAGERDQDRQEMMDMFSTAQSDGDITIEEKNAIVDEMLKRGYLGEAEKFHNIWQSRYENVTARKKVKADAAKEGDVKWGTTRTIVDNDPTSPTYRQKFFTVQKRVGSGVETVTTPVGGGDGEFQGDLKKAEIISTQYGETAVEVLQRRINRMEARSGLRKGEIKYKADYELTVREQEAWNEEKFAEAGKAPTYAKGFEDADTLLGLLEKIPTTSKLAAYTKELTDFFGVTPANIEEFDAKTREYVTTQLQMMGRNPTDFDLKFLLKVNPGMLKSRSGNLRLLTLLKAHNERKYELARDLGLGDYSRDRWYKKILIPTEDRLKEWRKKRKKLFGEPNVPNPDSVKTDQPRYKIVPDGQGGYNTVIDE